MSLLHVWWSWPRNIYIGPASRLKSVWSLNRHAGARGSTDAKKPFAASSKNRTVNVCRRLQLRVRVTVYFRYRRCCRQQTPSSTHSVLTYSSVLPAQIVPMFSSRRQDDLPPQQASKTAPGSAGATRGNPTVLWHSEARSKPGRTDGWA